MEQWLHFLLNTIPERIKRLSEGKVQGWALNYKQQLWVLVLILPHVYFKSLTVSLPYWASVFSNTWWKKWAPNTALILIACGQEAQAKLHRIHSCYSIPSGKCIWLVYEEIIQNNSAISLKSIFLIIEIFMTCPMSHCRLWPKQKSY